MGKYGISAGAIRIKLARRVLRMKQTRIKKIFRFSPISLTAILLAITFAAMTQTAWTASAQTDGWISEWDDPYAIGDSYAIMDDESTPGLSFDLEISSLEFNVRQSADYTIKVAKRNWGAGSGDLSAIKITSGDGLAASGRDNWNFAGLSIDLTQPDSNDSYTGQIKISGVPTSAAAAKFRIIGYNSEDINGATTTVSRDFTITINDYHVDVVQSPITIPINTSGVRKFDVTFSNGTTPIQNFPITSLDISYTEPLSYDAAIQWNNLTIRGVAAERTISVTGAPTEIKVSPSFTLRAHSASRNVTLTAQFTISVTSPSPTLPPLQKIEFPESAYYFPLGVELSGKSIPFTTVPDKYDLTVGGYSFSFTPNVWNGLFLADAEGALRVDLAGMLTTPGTLTFDATASNSRGDSVTGQFRVVAEMISSIPGIALLPQANTIMTDVAGKKLNNLTRGQINVIIFPLDTFASISNIVITFRDPDGYTGVLEEGTGAGGYGTYENIGTAVRAYFTPMKSGSYVFDIVYRQGETFFRETRTLSTSHESNGGGGCDSGLGAFGALGAAFTAIAAVIRRRG
jgi:hypothetical protein